MAKSERITQGESPIDSIFRECFIDFTDNPYAKTNRLDDMDKQWSHAKQQFTSKIEKLGITTNDLANWISSKAFWMIHNEENVDRYEKSERQRTMWMED